MAAEVVMFMSDRGRDQIPGPVDAVRLVEDAIDATTERYPCGSGCGVTTVRTGRAVVDALLEAGWSPPTREATMSVLRDDKKRITIGVHAGVLMAEPVDGDLRVRVGSLVGGTETRLGRADAVALRDWLTAALKSGAIR